ncbi:putative papain-like cysteine peptidase superfamily [Helianthus anomalus]
MLILETDPSVSRVSAFECGLKTNLSRRHHLVDLHDFDMVFVPVLEVDHYYLVVFNLEDERIYLIDHLGNRGSGVLIRDNETYILKLVSWCAYVCFCLLGTQKEIFVDYLKSVNHPKATVMQSSFIMRQDLPWSTNQRNAAQFVDSDGVYGLDFFWGGFARLDNYFCWDVDIYVGMWVSWTNTSWLHKTPVG